MRRINTEHHHSMYPGENPASARRHGEAGITLTELLVTIWMVAILAVIISNSALDAIERARLTRCMADVRGIQASVWMDSDNGMSFTDPAKFWSSHYNSTRPGPYFYLVDGNTDGGRGPDLDGIDEDNPGANGPDEKDIRFVLMCEHDHKWLADYVYLTDDQTPKIVGGENGAADPGYDRFIKSEFGGPGDGKGE